MDSVFETMVRINVGNRYAAHVEIDRLYASRTRQDRAWKYAIFDAGSEGFWALLRTTSDAVVKESPNPAAWKAVTPPAAGDEVAFFVQYSPKKATQFSRFFESDDFAIEQFAQRMALALTAPDVTLVGRQKIFIDKKTNRYSAPSAIFKVAGKVASTEAFHSLLMDGVGGSRSFGLGLAIDSQCQLHLLMDAYTSVLEA